jgi:DNA helicase-4
MKSKGEIAIANVLKKYNIEYEYEHPMLIKEKKKNDAEKLRIWYPDFWLPQYNIIIEYFGMMSNSTYKKGKEDKIKAYKSLNIDCIPVYPATIKKDLKAYLLIKIKQTLNAKVRHFENKGK